MHNSILLQFYTGSKNIQTSLSIEQGYERNSVGFKNNRFVHNFQKLKSKATW